MCIRFAQVATRSMAVFFFLWGVARGKTVYPLILTLLYPMLKGAREHAFTTPALLCMAHGTRTQNGKSAPGPKVAWTQKQILQEEQDYALR